jgi:hypothetical protein
MTRYGAPDGRLMGLLIVAAIAVGIAAGLWVYGLI